ncbi:hypothetical protein G6N05_05295 [Flavobacterium sp. F372]|uniref:Uncharacterized protein n=1 Tax=Flavobacterium bernardetii TaxID=2813823 RepID=A0ABR7J160_9FLAO|nr:hypothetical protein [Flavobacterium bernardetii]MBC5835795.1 hypothetical protein [Flavobacterium bernardetii]NHF69526.1 hypothetical protein [Flavobacterium bernardetii]
MNILQNKKFRAATWLDTSRIVEGNLHLLDHQKLQSADPKINRNGYLMVIIDNEGCKHLIAPDTLEIVENPHFSTITQLLLDNGLTTADIETFWTYSMQQAIKLCIVRNSGTVIFVNEGRSFGKTESMKRKFDELIKTADALMAAPTYSINESSSKYIGKSKNNFKK